MPLSDATKKQIEETVRGSDVVLFMKGNRQFPQCGFSSQVVQILNSLGAPYATVNVLTDPAIREGIIYDLAGRLHQRDKRLHFGLGSSTVAKTVEIRWPSGITQRLDKVAGDRATRIDET